MTQPYPQYQPAAGGYAAPQYPGIPGYPQVAPQSAPPAPPAYAPSSPAMGAGQGIAPPVPQLRDGGGSGGSASPKLRHLLGRTIVVVPHRVDETAVDAAGKSRPEAYFDLLVVDGGPLQYGDSQDRDPAKQRPNTHEIDTPCVFRNVNDYGQAFVTAVRDALAAGEAGRTGVVQLGTRGNRPPLITKTSTDVEGNARPDGEARFAAAMDLFGKYWADKHAPAGAPRQLPQREARSLVAPPAPGGYGAPQVNYGAPAQPAYAPPAAPQQYAVPGVQVPPGASYPVAGMENYQPAPAASVSAPAVDPAYAAWQAQQAVAMAAPPAPAAGQLPPHIEAWIASLPPEQQAVQRAALQASAPPQPAGPGI